MSRSRAGPVLAAGMAALVAGCQMDIDVAVTSTRGIVEFAVPAEKQPCIDRVTVYAASDPATPVWLIDSSDRTRCVTRFRYAEVPAGFVQRGPAEPLVNGRLYLVSVGRPGETGISFFEPGGEGSIERAAPGG